MAVDIVECGSGEVIGAEGMAAGTILGRTTGGSL